MRWPPVVANYPFFFGIRAFFACWRTCHLPLIVSGNDLVCRLLTLPNIQTYLNHDA